MDDNDRREIREIIQGEIGKPLKDIANYFKPKEKKVNYFIIIGWLTIGVLIMYLFSKTLHLKF